MVASLLLPAELFGGAVSYAYPMPGDGATGSLTSF